jgi:fatty-acyl-CoA synthase
MSNALQEMGSSTTSSSSIPWLQALKLTTPIASNRNRILSTVIDEVAAEYGSNAALLSDRESLSYQALAERARKYARWAIGQGLTKGDVVCLLMTNRPEYMAIWLGITSTGVVVSLLNTQLTGSSLAHCIRVASPRTIIVAAECMHALSSALPCLESSPQVWAHGAEGLQYRRIDLELANYSPDPLTVTERRNTGIDDLALYIYTSGTTGLPKAARVTHARVMQWSHWFAGMMQAVPSDRMYNCLPMYHSVGGVQATGAILVVGGTVVIREKFSASEFWDDILRWDCTLFQYIGEICRYLCHTAHSPRETLHRIRLACGNGMAQDVWAEFQKRFSIPHILEFYASTEGNLSLFNVPGKLGSIGHIPGYLAHRFTPALVLTDLECGLPVRDAQGFCIPCAPDQVGEALGKVVADPTSVGSRFDGYSSSEDTEKRVLRNVFELGDSWIRSGDLMRKDKHGFFYFVDRVGNTFRRKGENVATSEVSTVISEFPGVLHANVYGVAVPGADGRVGMAAVVADQTLSLEGLHQHLATRLSPYARPVFLRLRTHADLTGTFKYSTAQLSRQGYDPSAFDDPLYFDLNDSRSFVPLDQHLYRRIQMGEFRL